MTCGTGTASIPKDYKFENILRMKLTSDKFDKIIYYDTCIIGKPDKAYGKIIISDDCIYTYVENNKAFSLLSHFKDIVSMDLLNDVPQFIIGPMQDDCIHIQLIFNKANPKIVRNSYREKLPFSHTLCCSTGAKDGNSEGSNPLLTTNGSSTLRSTKDSFLVTSIDLYVLNKHSPIMALLKKAHTDYLIQQTLECSSTPDSPYGLSQNLTHHLFDGLILDISLTLNTHSSHRNFLLELVQSGHKYTRIKILFWSKPDLFGFLVAQFIERTQILFAIDTSKSLTDTQSSSLTVKRVTESCLDSVNLWLRVFNIFFCQTDHLLSKWQQLRQHNASRPMSLLRAIMELIGYLNRHDRCDSPDGDQSEIDFNIDYIKYDITINSIELIYYLICASQVPLGNDESDSFTIRSIGSLIESLTSYDNDEAVFNCFISHVLRMVFIWLFPEVHKIENRTTLLPQHVVTIFQLFTSLRTLLHCVPKMMEILRREMKEEFHYFMSYEISFSDDYYLSQPTFRLLKSFQKNVTNSNSVFVD